MLTGKTTLIAHIGYPIESFKAPMIYNPYFEDIGLDALVVPMGVKADNFPVFLRSVFQLSNMHGALITMPHKVTVIGLVDEVSTTAQIAGSVNAVVRRPDGTLLADMFDGEGFVRGVLRKGRVLKGTRVLVIGSGGVGSAIAASLVAANVAAITVSDTYAASAEALAGRLRLHYPDIAVSVGSNDPAGYDLVVNATPLGMKDDDALPLDVTRLSPSTFVGEVVMKAEMTPLLQAAQAKGCDFQIGTDMLFEMIPAYLEFFGYPTTTPDTLRRLAKIKY